MIRTIVVTGSASGIGKATVEWLRARGARVIGLDLHDAEIQLDLSTPRGRTDLVEAVKEQAPGGIDGVVASAGVANSDVSAVIGVNYFGAVATLEGLRPLLARSSRPRAVVVVSSASILPSDAAVVSACLAGDEAGAVAQAVKGAAGGAYAASKTALALWLRRAAVQPEWAGQGVLLNGVAPGTVKTPMTATLLATPEGRDLLRSVTPIAIGDYGQPQDIAELLGFLVTMEGGYLLGQLIFIDGGSDAILRPTTL